MGAGLLSALLGLMLAQVQMTPQGLDLQKVLVFLGAAGLGREGPEGPAPPALLSHG